MVEAATISNDVLTHNSWTQDVRINLGAHVLNRHFKRAYNLEKLAIRVALARSRRYSEFSIDVGFDILFSFFLADLF